MPAEPTPNGAPMLFSIPEPPPVPPYLRWDLADAIRYEDGDTLRVHADVWRNADGWCWSAEVDGYRPDSRGDPVPFVNACRKEPADDCDGAPAAKSAAETWIREQVAALGVGRG